MVQRKYFAVGTQGTSVILPRVWRCSWVEITLFAGLAQTISLLGEWALTWPGIAPNPPATLAFYYLLYGLDGPGFSVPMGCLWAGSAGWEAGPSFCHLFACSGPGDLRRNGCLRRSLPAQGQMVSGRVICLGDEHRWENAVTLLVCRA